MLYNRCKFPIAAFKITSINGYISNQRFLLKKHFIKKLYCNFVKELPIIDYIKGKIQHCAAWWFLGQKDGMEKQINALSNSGLLSCFVGMSTDSRSFLFFKETNILDLFYAMLLELILKMEITVDEAFLRKIVSDICYNSAKNYFNFK